LNEISGSPRESNTTQRVEGKTIQTSSGSATSSTAG